LGGHEPRHGLAVSRDSHFFTILNELQQLAQAIFCFECAKNTGGFHFCVHQNNLA